MPRGADEASPRARGGAILRDYVDALYRTIQNFSRIKMVVARASGADLASSLKQNAFSTLWLCPDGGHGGPRDGGHGGGPGRGATGPLHFLWG